MAELQKSVIALQVKTGQLATHVQTLERLKEVNESKRKQIDQLNIDIATTQAAIAASQKDLREFSLWKDGSESVRQLGTTLSVLNEDLGKLEKLVEPSLADDKRNGTWLEGIVTRQAGSAHRAPRPPIVPSSDRSNRPGSADRDGTVADRGGVRSGGYARDDAPRVRVRVFREAPAELASRPMSADGYHATANAVSSLPDVYMLTLPDDEAVRMVIGCDGIFDEMSSERAASKVDSLMASAAHPARGLVEFADTRGSTDNMTALVVHIPARPRASGSRDGAGAAPPATHRAARSATHVHAR